MARCTRIDHGIEVLRRRGFIELLDGQRVKRCVLQVVVVQHGGIGGLQRQNVVAHERLAAPNAAGIHGIQHGLKLAVHGHHRRRQRRRSIGLVGGEFGGGA